MFPPTPCCAGRARRWVILARLLVCALSLAFAGPAAVRAQMAADARTTGPDTEVRFDVELVAPPALQTILLRHLELLRYRELHDLDTTELERLLARAHDDLLDLLGAQGHFSPQIRIEGPLPAGATPLGTVRIQVDPGPVTRIASVQVYFRGDIADSAAAGDQRAAVRQAFDLRVGDAFTQTQWSDAKAGALRALTARRYPAGRLYNSLADVDTVDHSVRLSIELESGQPLQIDGVQIEGTERFDPAVIERLLRLSGITPGSDYDLARLQDAQQRLAATGYFDAVHVSVDPGLGHTHAPVRVQVREALRQKLVLGIGGSTDNGARLSVEHTHHRLPGMGWRAVSRLQLERQDRQLSTEWSAPVDEQGWQWVTSALAARQLDGFDSTSSQRLRVGQSQRSDTLDRSFFLQFDRARSVNALLRDLGSGQADAALTANYAWTRRRFDQLPFPQQGWGLGVELGAGYTLAGERRPFGRTVGRWLGYWPLGETTMTRFNGQPPRSSPWAGAGLGSHMGRLVLRAEAGAVWAKADTPVPETQLFLTGGDASVRGYALRNIGVPQADGGVSPGRYLGVGSAEWQRPVWHNGQRTPWETALFIDAGAVAEKVGDLKPRWGLGAGVRYNSPVGPLRLDLAYGVEPRAWRLHFNVGFTF
ncbi:MAG: autotransporter assembly complex protein TamA [Hydrogenophaga sp.]